MNIEKILGIILGINMKDFKKIVLYDQNHNIVKEINNKQILINNLTGIINNFINNYKKEILNSNDIWTNIALKTLNKKDLNIISDARFFTEFEEINKTKLNKLKILIIKIQNNKLNSNEINSKNFDKIYEIYTKSNNISDFIKNIQTKVTGSEELTTLLTIHYYLKKNSSNNKKINPKLDKEIEKFLKIDLVIFNEINNQALLNKNIKSILNQLQNKNLLIITANRRSGKDFLIEKLKEKEYLLKNPDNNLFQLDN